MILSCKLRKFSYWFFFFQSVGNEDEAEDVTSIVETEVHVQGTDSLLCESSSNYKLLSLNCQIAFGYVKNKISNAICSSRELQLGILGFSIFIKP